MNVFGDMQFWEGLVPLQSHHQRSAYPHAEDLIGFEGQYYDQTSKSSTLHDGLPTQVLVHISVDSLSILLPASGRGKQ